MTKIVKSCPQCQSSNLRYRPGETMTRSPDPTDWLCTHCGHEFDHVGEREPIKPGGGCTAEMMLEKLGVDPEVAMDD